MSDGTTARIDSISEFATQVQPLAGEFAEAAGTEFSTIMNAKLGASGTAEGAAAMQSHAIISQLTSLLTNDATLGVMALATGAQTIAVNYLTADAQQEDDMGIVLDAFSPAPGTGMQDAVAAQQQQGGGQGDTPPVAVDGSDVQLPEPTTEGAADPSQATQDQQRVEANQRAYGEDENSYDGIGQENLQTEGPPPPPAPHYTDAGNGGYNPYS